MESPPTKRFKLTEGRNIQIKAILPDEYMDTSLETVFASKIIHKQRISQLMQDLSQHLPFTLQHLKRVRGNEIIVSRKIDLGDSMTLEEFLSQTPLSKETIELLKENVSEVEVPAFACKLRCQYDIMHCYWPCKFHPDKHLESLYDGSCFTSTESSFHKRIVSLLLNISNDLESKRPCGICIDPRNNSIISVAASRTEINPFYHSSMVLIDFVARTQKPKMLNEQLTDNFGITCTEKDLKSKSPALVGIPQKYWDYIKQNEDFNTIEMGAEPVKQNKKNSAEHTFEPGIDNLAKYGPYLCTGYDVYLTDEPCLLCSMALVHSRAKRVFFIRQSIGNGALMTNFKLQAVKELNHHYEVFQCFVS